MPAEKDPLAAFRGEFPILRSSTCLVSNSLGAMARPAAKALSEPIRATAARRRWLDRPIVFT